MLRLRRLALHPGEVAGDDARGRGGFVCFCVFLCSPPLLFLPLFIVVLFLLLLLFFGGGAPEEDVPLQL